VKRKRLSPGPRRNIIPECAAAHPEEAMAFGAGQSLSFTHGLTNFDKASERSSK
jgi:hypothetical protein